MKTFVRYIISLAIGGVLLWITFRYFDMQTTAVAIRNARLDLLGTAFLLIVLAYFLRGRRWMIWEPGLKYSDSFRIIMIGFMGNNILPARLGEVLRAHCAAPKINSTHGRTATLASIAIERILDGFVISLLGTVGLFLVPLKNELFLSLLLVCIIFFSLTGFLIAGNFFHQRIRLLGKRIHTIFPGHLTEFGNEKLNYFLDGLSLIHNRKRFLSALSLTLLIWGVELCGYFLIAVSVFSEAELNQAFIFIAVVNFASLFPFTVGGLGAIEGATTPFLISAGIPFSQALAMVLIQHGFQIAFTTLTGGTFFFSSKYYKLPVFSSKNRAKEVLVTASNQPPSRALINAQERLDELAHQLDIRRKSRPAVDLSIVIPAYNESGRLPKTVLSTITWCRCNCTGYEIILVDDGSSDDTLTICQLFAEYDDHLKVISNPHLGKGAAVRSGMLNAEGHHVLFMDADGATPLDEIVKLREKLTEGYKVAIGSRVVQHREETTVITSFHRKFIGRTFAAIVNIFGVSGIGDTQCGFKMFDAAVVREIFSRQKLAGFAFDVELLFLARKLGLEIAEVPVNWVNQEGSKVNLVVDSVLMLRDVLRLKVLHRNI